MLLLVAVVSSRLIFQMQKIEVLLKSIEDIFQNNDCTELTIDLTIGEHI